MVLRVQAILPKFEPIANEGIERQIQSLIGGAGFAGSMIRRMADYPPQRPTSYRRTGTLGRNWRMVGPRVTANAIIAEARNNTQYVVHVEGPKAGAKGRRQVAVMRERGWPNITDAAQAEWKRWRPRVVRVLMQQDPTVRRRAFRI